MPNSYATLKRERTISTLAKSLFDIEGAGRTDALRVAEAALLRANPSLAHADAFRSGRIIIVPTDTGLKTTDRVTKAKGGVGGALDDTSIRLRMASQLLENEIESNAKASEKTLKQLNERQFLSKMKKAAPESEMIIPQTRKSIKECVKTAEVIKVRYTNAIETALAEIERLTKMTK
jgi:hypothetical protein